MKAKNTQINLIGIYRSLSKRRHIPLALVSAVVLMLLGLSAKAGNILVNPDLTGSAIFTTGSWSQHASETWSMAPASAADPTKDVLQTNGGGLWMQGLYGNGQGGPQTSYAAQDFACFPGNTYTASAMYSAYTMCQSHIGGDDGSLGQNVGGSGLFGNDGNNEDGWVEVLFYNSGNVLVADYKSTIVTAAFEGGAADAPGTPPTSDYSGPFPLVTNSLGNIYLAWLTMPVTNQYDVTTVTPNTDPDPALALETVSSTLKPGQLITAPAGAVKVEYRISLYQAVQESGAPFWGTAVLNQVGGPSASVIGNLNPDGTKFFNAASTNFTFNVTSAAQGGAPLPTNSASGIGIVVNGVDETGILQITGPSTNLAATLPGITTNTIYTITVSTTNSVGLRSSQSVTFDTFPTSVFIVSAEDYDFTNGGFIENPVPTAAPAPDSYFGTAGVLGVDVSTYNGTGTLPGGASQLVRSDGYTAMQKAADIQLPQYVAANDPTEIYNVQIAYNNPGNWENYTRNYPAGHYLVYLRYNDNVSGSTEDLNLVTSGYGTANQTTTTLGEFISQNTGAGYAWLPLTDTGGNKVVVNLAAGRNTLQLFSGGLENFVDFIFVPTGTAGFPPNINNLAPNTINAAANTDVFLTNEDITFSVSSVSSTIAQSDIQTLVNGVDVSSSETITGFDTDWNVSLPCPQNQLINLAINVKDASGLTNQVKETFDTFSQNNMMIEGVDWDFNGGQFIDNPVPTAPNGPATNSYFAGGINGTNVSVFNIDYDGTYDGEVLGGYRDNDNGFQCEVSSDFVRNKFIDNGSTDYDLGYYNGGQWANYTRTFPSASYNVYGRMAGGAGPFSGTTLAEVTSGRKTTNQTAQVLGSFADANAAAWQTWHWVPMRDTNGNLATLPLGGVQTLKLTSGNNVNVNFLMFVSTGLSVTATTSGGQLQLSFATQSGHNYDILTNNVIGNGSWGVQTTIAGDGTTKTNTETIGSGDRFYEVRVR